ncbi:MAG: indolepyruvate oxidoreductase subunit beta family protein [Rhodospirillaceae bacterium]
MNTQKPITIAVMALGGQGGGTLADWLIEVAEHSGYFVQGTSVQGVAQRTGATIYYIELFPEAAARAAGKDPVLALMPVPGNVDLVVAAELMEAGRAMIRGLVTPDRTALIASSHRIYAISEKSAMGDGRADSAQILEAATAQAKWTLLFDMEELARQKGSVISAVLFGAIAGSGALPFARQVYEDVINADSRARESNLAAFAAGYENAQAAAPAKQPSAASPVHGASHAGRALLEKAAKLLPAEVLDIAVHGLRKVVDYQDIAYGEEYLSRLGGIAATDRQFGGGRRGWELTREAARHLALWMAFEDVFRVADLKTRGARFDRVREEVRAAPGQIVGVSEFMHPRVEELCDALPAGIGRFVLRSAGLRAIFGRLFGHGRRVTTTSLGGFLTLFIVARLGRFRRHSLRFQNEMAAIDAWLSAAAEAAAKNYDLSVEIVACQRLVKGYGSTHERGMRNFETLMAAYRRLIEDRDVVAKIKHLRQAALSDEEGAALQRELGAIGLA